jgi:D-amino-acid dehydrogenase
LRLLRDGAELYLREPWTEPVTESWWGWRPMTPDSVPHIGAIPAFDNVWIAAGHGMLGVSMSPATGKLVAEMMSGSAAHIEPKPYRVGRH